MGQTLYNKTKGTGTLYVVATPIGNLGDITVRAVEILKQVTFVLAEDTRQTAKLFQRYEITTRMVSYRDQNHDRMIGKIEEKLDVGLDLALVSDNGTPLISDPGYKLVARLREQGYAVVPVPGASAVISALSVSGLPTDKFVFLGFLPKSEKRRHELLARVPEGFSAVLYESPHRIMKLLDLLVQLDKFHKVFLAKDMTKKHEEFFTGTPVEVQESLKAVFEDGVIKGEWVVICSAK